MPVDRPGSGPINVGVIGLGEVAQIVHLPILASRPELFRITALCDVSPQLVATLGNHYRVERQVTAVDDLLATRELDAVMVLTSDEYHADCVVAACRAGKHVFVEKPVCLNLREGQAILDARNEADVSVMVGYMRRYAPAFVDAVAEVGTWDAINYARFRDIIGVNRLLIDQTSVVHRFDDVPAALARDRVRRAERLMTEAVGEVTPPLRVAYRLLCGLASHDTSAMRELLGPPDAVVAARQWNGGRFMTVIFDYGAYCATLELGVDHQKRFDASIEVHGDLKTVRVQYETPYIRQLPTVLRKAETIGEAHVETVLRPTYKDAYVCELEAFHQVVARGAEPKTSAEDALLDLELYRRIVTAFSAEQT